MKNISVKEFIWYVISGLIVAFGLILIIFGIIGHHMTGPYENNFVKQFEEGILFDLRTWGIIFMALGALVAVFALLYNAKKADRDVEKKIRREQRIAAQANQNIEVKKAVEVIEEPAPETK